MADSIFQNPGLELLGEQNQSLKFMINYMLGFQ